MLLVVLQCGVVDVGLCPQTTNTWGSIRCLNDAYGLGIGLLVFQNLVASAAIRSREIGAQVVRGIQPSLIVIAFFGARVTGNNQNGATRLVVFHLSGKVAIVQGCQSSFEQFLEFVICDVVTLVEGLVLRQELIVDGIPINPLATFVVPDTIVLVEGFP